MEATYLEALQLILSTADSLGHAYIRYLWFESLAKSVLFPVGLTSGIGFMIRSVVLLINKIENRRSKLDGDC